MNKTSETIASLRCAIQAKDPDKVEEALNQAFGSALSADLLPTLVDLLGMPWHTRHEDVIRALQELKPPSAVQALRKAAVTKHQYLDYDEFFGLARKCTWALADIGTPEAKDALRELAKLDNVSIASYAQKRLDNWDKELNRKGA